MSESDEARWALYYGVKQLAKNTRPDSGGVEAKLFYNFLDEKYGEDEMTFFLFTYVGCVFSPGVSVQAASCACPMVCDGPCCCSP